ncbi:anthranilate phosphoribosyltransferase [Clostridium sp. LP20]|uniref:anthranilate phosphoribosyltransferase n=1 Tax=Clostridium sp. LP20 TaxID=3418665 RepID=UPI003EE5B360
MKINDAMKKLITRQNLTEEECTEVIKEIMRGETTSAQKGGFLVGLKVKGETSEELLGAVKALRTEMITVDIENREHLVDCCGTGGDGGNTFNISTAVAIVIASGGAKVAKHGNRAVSSKSGSLDVLRELGIRVDYDREESKKIIEEKGMAFLLAPNYNKGMKNVAKERLEIGTRTLFNMVGPLLNPAPLTGQLMGIYDGSLLETVADVLLNLGLDRAMVVHGDDGLDEITITTTTTVCEIKDGKVTKYTLDPSKYGIKRSELKEIAGGTPEENAKVIIEVLKGEKSARRDIVILNSGAALYVAKIVDSLEEGINMAKELIDSGKAFRKYQELAECV